MQPHGVQPLQDDKKDRWWTPDDNAFRCISLTLAAWTVPLVFTSDLLLSGEVLQTILQCIPYINILELRCIYMSPELCRCKSFTW